MKLTRTTMGQRPTPPVPIYAGSEVGPRPVTALGGEKRWACRACARTHAARHRAEQCCAETVDPAWLAGGELLPRGHRTQREVLDQLEARMAELEKEAARRKEAPPSKYPCATCKWSDGEGNWLCTQPLVKGFDPQATSMDWNLQRGHAQHTWDAQLCGIEKALWEPKPDPAAELRSLLSDNKYSQALSAAKFQGAGYGVMTIAIIYLIGMIPEWL